jgi:hypothetical protein
MLYDWRFEHQVASASVERLFMPGGLTRACPEGGCWGRGGLRIESVQEQAFCKLHNIV